MCSYASDGGGVGPHVDSYDVFLLQAQGRRRWRIGRAATDAPARRRAAEDARRLRAEQEWLLEPGDMLYLPPGWAHDGVAVGECITASIGFRAPRARRARGRRRAAASPKRRATTTTRRPTSRAIATPATPAADRPARIPAALQRFADAALERLLADRAGAVARARRGAERAQARHLVRARGDVAAAPAARSRSIAAPACSTTIASSSSTARRTAPAGAMRH